MYPDEQKIKSTGKTMAFTLFMLLISSYFKPETVMILLLCLIYMKMRD